MAGTSTLSTGIFARYEDYVGSTFYNRNGTTPYRIGSMIKSGGEGGVFNIRGNDSLVAKVYSYSTLSNPTARALKENKIGVMLSQPVKTTRTPDGMLLIAWPIDALYFNGQFVGYVMPKVHSRDDLNVVTNTTLCRSHFPNFSWRIKVMIAHNLAYIVQLVHEAGHVIGDMNPENLLVNSDGIITVIDTDSFSVNDWASGATYPCEVGVEEYLAPEIQFAGRVSGRRFTQETDCFALAVNLFRLLMGGYHPFTCTTQDSGSSVPQTPIQANIVEGICPFVRNIPGHSTPPGAPLITDMPPYIKDLFTAAFGYDASNAVAHARLRPNAFTWRSHLYALFGDDSSYKECKAKLSTQGVHVYYAGLHSCPWCAAQARQDNANKAAIKQIDNRGNTHASSGGSSGPISIKPGSSTTTNTSGSSGFGNAQSTFIPHQVRSVVPLWIAFIIVGILSGLSIADPFTDLIVVKGLDIDMSVDTVMIILAILGGIAGGVIAHMAGDRYEDSNHPGLWYLLLIPMPLIVGIAGALIALIIILALIALGFAIVGAICGGS